MARTKQSAPTQRHPSQAHQNGTIEKHSNDIVTKVESAGVKNTQSDVLALIGCVGGIYASFLYWAFLQEKLTTTEYGLSKERWTYSIVLNTIQSAFAACSGFLYLVFSSSGSIPSPFPSQKILGPLVLVAIVSSLASPFGYAALGHVDYITYILAKSCKLLPVMALHLTIFRKRYPFYKYAVVGAVTAGVAVFTLHSDKKGKSKKSSGNSTWGLFLLGVNLLFDGLTNSTQDHIFTTFKPYSGPQMMVAQNILATILTTSYLVLLPLAPQGLLSLLSLPVSASSELSMATAFLQRHPAVIKDVIGFALCGAIGQIFIYLTLARFSSLLLVTVTVTRKMLTMMLSVLWFGHRLSSMQWLGVGLVFGGVGAEGLINRREKMAKELEKERAKQASAAGSKKEL